METTFIYVLTEPGTRTIRYFGKADDPKDRRQRHIREAKKGENWYVSRWIRKLLSVGNRPDVHVLCEVPRDDFSRFERAFIALGRQYGFDLTNILDGGDGGPSLRGAEHPMFGKKHSAETCAKMSAALSGEKNPMFGKSPNFGKECKPETRAKIGRANSRPKPPGFGRKMHVQNLGRKHTPEELVKMRVKRAGASSHFYGVCWSTNDGAWKAQISQAPRIYIGLFSDELEAAKAYDAAAKIHHGAHAVLNFP